ncbi:hypothetical protein EYC84_008924 [Monilinia fructicola]|uniref:Uncharacterized protein n=1 Tax=Monilinia fructicola TaxID=38448 RepID=A0A5M9JAT0_MONFR|nr:hypothetical protein EYC84_008924 [Monilinia fructicola]
MMEPLFRHNLGNSPTTSLLVGSYKDSTDSRVSCVISTINCALICQSTVSLLHTIQLDQYNSNNQSSA